MTPRTRITFREEGLRDAYQRKVFTSLIISSPSAKLSLLDSTFRRGCLANVHEYSGLLSLQLLQEAILILILIKIYRIDDIRWCFLCYFILLNFN